MSSQAVNYEDSIIEFAKNAFIAAWNESMSDSTKDGVRLWHNNEDREDVYSEITPEEAMDFVDYPVNEMLYGYLGAIVQEDEADAIIKQLDNQYGDGYAPIELVWEEPETKAQEMDNKQAHVNALVERCIRDGLAEGACSILDK